MRADAPFKAVLLLLPMLLASPAHAAVTLKPHRVAYNVEISILNGTLTTVVTEVGAGFMANSVIKPVGLSKIVARGAIQESSFFLTDENGVRPEQYRSIDTLSSDNEYVNFDFDWRAKTVEGTVNDEPIEFKLEGRVHDRVSIQYQLMLDLLNGGASEQYFMLDGDELKQLEVRNIGEKQVKVPFGTFDAVGIQHRKENSSRTTVLWCAVELDYLPVVIEQHRDGELRVRAVLTEYEVMTPAAAKAAD